MALERWLSSLTPNIPGLEVVAGKLEFPSIWRAAGLATALSTLVFILVIRSYLRATAKEYSGKGYPPGPPILPVVGSLLAIVGGLPHHLLTDLARKKNWPLMTLKFASGISYVASSPEIISEVLIKSGTNWASRKPSTNFAAQLLFQTKKGEIAAISAGEYGHPWRVRRKLLAIALIGCKKEFGDRLLREQIEDMFVEIEHGGLADGKHQHNVRHVLAKCVTGYFLRLIYGRRFERDDALATELMDMNKSVATALSKAAAIDMMPFLKYFLKQWNGILETTVKRKKQIVEELLAYRAKLKETEDRWYLCDTYLEAERVGESDREANLILLDEILLAGVETTVTALEWILSELLLHPHVYHKLQRELDQAMSNGQQLTAQVAENLPYLNAVVKESFRIHTPLPFLIPHCNEAVTTLASYEIPANSSVLVNVHAVSRDPKIWSKPERFTPERFLAEDVDMTGADVRLLPFGGGRRVCPGIPIAIPTLNLLLGYMVRRYDISVLESNRKFLRKAIFGAGVKPAKPLHVGLAKRSI